MTEKLNKIQTNIKRKISFGWNPTFESEIQTDLTSNTVIPIIMRIFEDLEWQIVYQDENSVEAKCRLSDFNWGHKIFVKFEDGCVKVKSRSQQSMFFDLGNNSMRVGEFINKFTEIQNQLDKEELSKIEKEFISNSTWDDYQIPKILPLPNKLLNVKMWIPIVGGFALSLVLGFLISFASKNFTYVIGLYEVIIGVLIGLAFFRFVKASNVTSFRFLNFTMIGVIITIYVLNQYFYFLGSHFNNGSIGFFKFMTLVFQQGIKVDGVELGSIGLVISWVIQLGITYAVAYYALVINYSKYLIGKIPKEVVNFAYYHLSQKKDLAHVRMELSKMGWDKEKDQNEVFKCISAIIDINTLNRA